MWDSQQKQWKRAVQQRGEEKSAAYKVTEFLSWHGQVLPLAHLLSAVLPVQLEAVKLHLVALFCRGTTGLAGQAGACVVVA